MNLTDQIHDLDLRHDQIYSEIDPPEEKGHEHHPSIATILAETDPQGADPDLEPLLDENDHL